jgi:hypothetical protein
MQIRGQAFVFLGSRAIINNRNYRQADILLNGLKERLAHQPRTTKYGVDVDEKRNVWIMFEQAKNLVSAPK